MLYTDYLEHYGVKGMKWGVRKDPDESDSKSVQDFSISNERSHTAYLIYEEMARQNYKKQESNIKKVSLAFGTPFSIEPDMSNRMWETAYKVAAEQALDGLGPEEQLILITQAALEQAGIGTEFNISVSSKNGKQRIVLTHVKTGDEVYSVQSAISYMRLKFPTQRKRDIPSGTAPVQVKKGRSVGGVPQQNIAAPSLAESLRKQKRAEGLADSMNTAITNAVGNVFKKKSG